MADCDIRVAVLVVSDRATLNVNFDKSGPAIQELLERHKFPTPIRSIVPDDEADIQEAIRSWCKRGDINWIITTGGTGFGVRDRTPEAIRPLLEREAPGLVHLLLSTSLTHTPLAALSRPIAGTVGNVLIVTLPGSVKAVRENLGILLSSGVVGHAIDLIRGGSGEIVHSALASGPQAGAAPLPVESTDASPDCHHGGHTHHHHHAPRPRTALSHDPAVSASGRHRKSPYPILSFDAAMNIIFATIERLQIIKLPVTPALRGHVLAEDVYAPQNVPFFSTTNVDGYALRSTDKPGVYKVLTSATHPLSADVPADSIYRVNTGGPLPAGTDTVIMVEDTHLVSTVKNSAGQDIEEGTVETLVQLPAGENVRAPGSDVKRGDLVLRRGDLIRSIGGEIGTLAFVGRSEVAVYRKPVVALLSTGNELIDLNSQPTKSANDGWTGIWDTNRPSLQAALEGMGYKVVDIGIVPDDTDSHVEAIKRGLESADLLLTTGGTSMGVTDLLKPVIESRLHGTIHFGRVAVKPGKPTTFATIPHVKDGRETTRYVFALPGNPASALVTFNVFVVPALRKLGGWPSTLRQLPRIDVTIQDPMKLDPRVEFHRVVIRAEADGFKAYSTGGQRSSRVASLSGANGLVILPMKKAGGPDKVLAGQRLQAILIDEIQMPSPVTGIV